MARMLETPLPARRGGHRTEKYPFDEWFTANDKGEFPVMLIVKGEDYDVTDASIRSSLKNAAEKRNLKIETRAHQDGDEHGLIFQAAKPAKK